MNTSLDSLDPRFKPIAIEFLARLVEQRIVVLIVNTRRTDAEQADAIARGVSWVKRSKHQDGLAMDVVPYDLALLHGDDKLLWNTNDPVWLRIRDIAERLGLRSGARFTPLNAIGVGKDPGHVELVLANGSNGVPV